MRLEAHLVENDGTVTGDWGSELVFASLESDLPSAAPTDRPSGQTIGTHAGATI